MRDFAGELLGDQISRRAFIRKASAAGFSLAAAESAANALAPLLSSSTQRTAAAPFVGTGGELLAEQLRAFGTRFVFVCNSSGMGALCDALVDRPDMRFIQAVSENQVVGMADGYAKATGRASFACFSRVGGPLASANMYNSMKDRTPVVIFADHADTSADGRDGHEDLDDWLEPFKQYTKWRWLAKEGARIPEWIAHAFKISTIAPGGPTFVRVPRNVLYQKNLKAEVFSRESISTPMRLTPDPALIERAARDLIEASSPILYVGPEVWTSGARADVVELAELLAIPVTQARSWAADFPTDHPLYLGGYFHPMRFPEEIDLFLNLGAKMPDQGGGPPMVPRSARVIHARIESHQLGVNYPVDHAIVADVKETARALVEAVKSTLTVERLKAVKQSRSEKIEPATSALRESYRAAARDGWDSSPITWPRLLLTLDETLDDDAIIVEELGTEDWVSRSFAFADGKKTKIGRTLGRSLGWGVSASIGVKLARPDQQVVERAATGGLSLFSTLTALHLGARAETAHNPAHHHDHDHQDHGHHGHDHHHHSHDHSHAAHTGQSDVKTRARRNPDQTNVNPYEAWLKQEGVPVYRSYHIADLRAAEVKPWKRVGALGAHVDLVGGEGVNAGYICEIPTGASTNPQRYLFEEVIYVLSGEGETVIWNPGGSKQSVKWKAGAVIAPPLNVWRQHINRGTSPARFLSMNNAPVVIDLFHNADFVFNNDFVFRDRYEGETNYFRDGKENFHHKQTTLETSEIIRGVHTWDSGFVPDARTIGLAEVKERGQGNSRVELQLAENTMQCHISEFEVGTYKKAHRHGPGSHVVMLNGRGYTLMWKENIKYSESKTQVRVDWTEGSLFVPPDGWFHQHFNSGTDAARYLAPTWGGATANGLCAR